MEFRISITSISLKRGLTKMGFYVFPFYLFIASQLHGYLISHLLGLGLRAACPWRSLCPQVPTQISGNQFSVQRLSTSFFFSTTGHGKWKTLPEAHIFAPIKKWWVGRRSFPFWEGLFSGATVVFGLDFHGIVLFQAKWLQVSWQHRLARCQPDLAPQLHESGIFPAPHLEA